MCVNPYVANLAFLNQEKQNASLESDEDISGTCEALLSMVDDNSNTERCPP